MDTFAVVSIAVFVAGVLAAGWWNASKKREKAEDHVRRLQHTPPPKLTMPPAPARTGDVPVGKLEPTWESFSTTARDRGVERKLRVLTLPFGIEARNKYPVTKQLRWLADVELRIRSRDIAVTPEELGRLLIERDHHGFWHRALVEADQQAFGRLFDFLTDQDYVLYTTTWHRDAQGRMEFSCPGCGAQTDGTIHDSGANPCRGCGYDLSQAAERREHCYWHAVDAGTTGALKIPRWHVERHRHGRS